MAPDVYEKADDLVIRLRIVGADRWADDINEAIDVGSTGTEIFMALRRVLIGVAGDQELDAETRVYAATLTHDLNQALES